MIQTEEGLAIAPHSSHHHPLILAVGSDVAAENAEVKRFSLADLGIELNPDQANQRRHHNRGGKAD